jgi:hypothetical protein
VNQTARIAVFVLAAAVASAAFSATVPVILTITPQTVVAGTGGFTLTVNGTNFVTGATVLVNGTSRTTTFVSSSQVTAGILSSDVLNAGTLQITATNPGTLRSGAVTLTVLPNNPTITSINPSSLNVGTQNLILTINGQNFASTAQARVNGTNRATTFVSDSQLTATLIAADVAGAATLQITVANPNLATSNSVPLTVKVGTALPAITVLSPSSVAAGGTSFGLSVVGQNFVDGANVKANGALRTTTFFDSSHLMVQIASSDIAKAGTVSIVVTNPDGSTSTAAPLTVTAGLIPTILSLSPSSVTAGASAFTLTINGSNFVTGTTVQIGSSSRAATVVNSKMVVALVTSADVLNAGQVPVTVTTPPPNGGVSNSLPLFIVSALAPTATSIVPASVTAGSQSFTLLINGSNFQIDDIVQIGGSPRVTLFVDPTHLAAAVPASDVANPGTLAVTVTRINGSGVSAPLTLTVTAANAPAITGFSPASAAVGQLPFTLAIIGHNFDVNSVVLVDTAPRTTQFVSPTELDINFTAADLTMQRDIPVQVASSDGSTTPTVLFSVTVPQMSITSINPATVISGDVGLVLTVVGTNFSPQSVINVNGTSRTTQVQPDGSLTTNIDSSEISAPGILIVTVSANGGTSASVGLQVLRPAITSVDPAVILLGSSSVAMTVHGSAFLATSKVIFKGAEKPTTLNADGTLTATLTGTDLADPGVFAVTVKNSPNSTSLAFLVEIASAGPPQVFSVTPSSLPVGSSNTTIFVTGASFVPNSVVLVNGLNRETTFGGGQALTAALLPADLSAPGQLRISVRNPDGATSGEVLLTVTPSTFSPPRRRATPHSAAARDLRRIARIALAAKSSTPSAMR